MLLFSIVSSLYALAIYLVSPFNRKARLLVRGHRVIFKTLKHRVDKERKYLWFHVSSLGEFEQARPLIERIHSSHPECKILLTFFSPSGYEVRKDYPLADIICYIPFDLKQNVNRFLSLITIEKAFFIKYEFWPNFLKALHDRAIEVYSISSIFRDNQLFFKWYGAPYASSLSYFTHLFVQDRHSKDLLSKIGIKNISIVGDTRCDRVYEEAHKSTNYPNIEQFVNGNPTFIAGSSWPQDEVIYGPYFNDKSNWKIIIAPHEFDELRLQQLEERFASQHPIRLSNLSNEVDTKQHRCLIIDCFGLLSSIYRYGHVAYIGGGFGGGIHNILEAAVFDIPIIFGPNNKKFREAQDLKNIKGGFEVSDEYSLRTTMDKFVSDPTFMKRAGRRAGEYVRKNCGTTDQILYKIGL